MNQKIQNQIKKIKIESRQFQENENDKKYNIDTDIELESEGEEIKILTKQFDDALREMRKQRNLIGVMGPPKSGKSHLMRQIMVDGSKAGKWEWIQVYSVTAHNGDYDFIENRSHVIVDESDFEDNIQALLLWQVGLIKQAKELTIKTGQLILPPIGNITIEDPLGSVNFKKPIYTKLMSTFRNFLVDVYVITQYIVALPKAFYTYAMRFFIFKMGQISDYEYIYNRILSAYKSQTNLTSKFEVQNFFEKLQQYHFVNVNSNGDAKINVGISKTEPLETFEKYIIQF